MSNSILQQNRFAEYIAYALNELVKNSGKGIKPEQIYKFSMNVWIDFDRDKKEISVADVKLIPLNKALGKKYRKTNENRN